MIESAAFDQFAHDYDQWFENHAVEYAQELNAIRQLLPHTGTGIEIGAGTGRFTQPLNISVGVEPSEAMRRIALSRGVKVIAGTAEAIPVDSCSYDFALLVTADCFIKKPQLAFKELYRILKAEGLIIIGMIDKNSHLGRKYRENQASSKFYQYAHFHSIEEMQGMLEQAGFGNIEYRQAILPGDSDKHGEPMIKSGYGEGSFVVLRALKHDT